MDLHSTNNAAVDIAAALIFGPWLMFEAIAWFLFILSSWIGLIVGGIYLLIDYIRNLPKKTLKKVILFGVKKVIKFLKKFIKKDNNENVHDSLHTEADETSSQSGSETRQSDGDTGLEQESVESPIGNKRE